MMDPCDGGIVVELVMEYEGVEVECDLYHIF